MKSVTVLVTLLMGVCLVGCSFGNDEGADEAIKLVQDFQPSPKGPIASMLKSEFSNDAWTVLKTSDGLYRVTYQGSRSGRNKELLFGVSIKGRHVMALNKDALAYTNPL